MARVALIDVHRAAMWAVDGGGDALPVALGNRALQTNQSGIAFRN
jgi:hypothetical protein